jgi:hypothetical protein
MGETMRTIHTILSLDLGSEKGERRLRNNLDNSFLRCCVSGYSFLDGWRETFSVGSFSGVGLAMKMMVY